METQFFEVKVTLFDFDEESGKVKKLRKNYLVNSVSVTESEAKVTNFLISEGWKDYEINSSKQSKIVKVIE